MKVRTVYRSSATCMMVLVGFVALANEDNLGTVVPGFRIVVRESFESNHLDMGLWKYSGNNSITTSSRYARDGRRSGQFVLNPTTATVPYRTELELRKPRSFRYGRRYQFSLSTLVPESWLIRKGSEIVVQWHARPDNPVIQRGRFPCVTLRIATDHWYVRINSNPLPLQNNDSKYLRSISRTISPVEFGKWDDWTFEINWAYTSDGVVRVKRNGVLVFEYLGPNCYNDTEGPYMKIGIYKPEWRTFAGAKLPTREIYIDDLTISESMTN